MVDLRTLGHKPGPQYLANFGQLVAATADQIINANRAEAETFLLAHYPLKNLEGRSQGAGSPRAVRVCIYKRIISRHERYGHEAWGSVFTLLSLTLTLALNASSTRLTTAEEV